MSDHDPIADLQNLLQEVIKEAQRVNAGPLRCRELSLAVTHLEDADNWLERILRSRQTELDAFSKE